MATASLDGVVRHLRRAAFLADAARLTDAELLDCYLTRAEEAAFEVLVRRHGPMVLRACLRVLPDVHDAEDAFQATFLVLVRKAASVWPRDRLGPWLQGVARRTAFKARAQVVRRRARETPLRDRAYEPSDGSEGDSRADLDRAVARLPAKYRELVVRCELQGEPRAVTACRLGLPEGTVSSRLARARRLLARRLARHGPAASLVVPPPLITETVRAATNPGGVSAPVAALVKGVLQTMWIAKLKSMLGMVLAVGLLLGGAGLMRSVAVADKPADAKDAKKAKAELGPRVTGSVRSVDAAKSTITVGVYEDGRKFDRTFDVAKEAKVILEQGLVKGEEKEGRLADLPAGSPCVLQLTADKKTVIALRVRGRTLIGHVKSVDATANTLTITIKGESGPEDKILKMAKEAKIILDDGLAKNQFKEAKLTDLAEDTPVHVQLTGTDEGLAIHVQVRGVNIIGSVKGLDGGNNTITLLVKEDGNLVEKTYTLAKGARIEGNAVDGVGAVLTMSVFDKNTVVAVRVLQD